MSSKKTTWFKLLGALVLVVVVLLVLAVVFAGSIIKTSIEQVGSKVTQCDIKVRNVDLSLIGGKLTVDDLVVGNPDGFKTENAFRLSKVHVSLLPLSLVGSKIKVNDIQIIGPEITYEIAPLSMVSNIGAIQKNVQSFLPSGSEEKEKTEGKALQIDHLVVKDGVIKLSATFAGGKVIDVPLPAIELNGIGKDSDMTGTEVSAQVLDQALGSVSSVASESMKSLGSGIKGLLSSDKGEDAKEAVKDAADGAVDAIKDSAETIKESASEALEKTGDKAKEAGKALKGLFGK